jgi:putative FmdB family regulatory protein
MPTYDYRCTKCGHVAELFHSIKDDTVKHCERCGARAERVPSGGAGLLFRGSGFYITDYRSKGYRERARQEGGASGRGEGGKHRAPGGEGGGSSGGGGDKGSAGGGAAGS